MLFKRSTNADDEDVGHAMLGLVSGLSNWFQLFLKYGIWNVTITNIDQMNSRWVWSDPLTFAWTRWETCELKSWFYFIKINGKNSPIHIYTFSIMVQFCHTRILSIIRNGIIFSTCNIATDFITYIYVVKLFYICLPLQLPYRTVYNWDGGGHNGCG